MTLDNINTKSFLFNPKEPNFEQLMIDRSSVFNLNKNRKKYLTYISVMYDLNSEIRRNFKDYNNRKFEAAKIAGFEVEEGRFKKDVENTLLGEDENFNKAVIQMVYYSFNNDYKLLFILEEQYNKSMSEYSSKIVDFDEKSRKLLTTMKEQIEEIENKIFGGGETINLRKALYSGIDSTRSRLPRKENELIEFEENGLIDYSPYGSYQPSKLKFVGDRIPI